MTVFFILVNVALIDDGVHPGQTFLNLSIGDLSLAKQTLLLDLALEDFVMYGYTGFSNSFLQLVETFFVLTENGESNSLGLGQGQSLAEVEDLGFNVAAVQHKEYYSFAFGLISGGNDVGLDLILFSSLLADSHGVTASIDVVTLEFHCLPSFIDNDYYVRPSEKQGRKLTQS